MRHPGGPGAAHLRSIFHDEGGGHRHGPGALHHLRHYQRTSGHDQRRRRLRRGDDIPGCASSLPRRGRCQGAEPMRSTTTTRVLIVDDDSALLQALPQMLRLRMEPMDIDTYNSAPAALEQIISTDYDVIVSDIK